eukprot:Nk52_evm44s2531 gene=Nk52_evmTU44s2531
MNQFHHAFLRLLQGRGAIGSLRLPARGLKATTTQVVNRLKGKALAASIRSPLQGKLSKATTLSPSSLVKSSQSSSQLMSKGSSSSVSVPGGGKKKVNPGKGVVNLNRNMKKGAGNHRLRVFSNHEYPELTVLSHYAEDMSRFQKRSGLIVKEQEEDDMNQNSPPPPPPPSSSSSSSSSSLAKGELDAYSCIALCTSEEYDLNKVISIVKQRYNLRTFFFPYMEVDAKTAVHTYVYERVPQPGDRDVYVKTGGEIFFFRDGSFVCWDVAPEEIGEIRRLLREEKAERGPYDEGIMEFEHVNYGYRLEEDEEGGKGGLFKSEKAIERQGGGDAANKGGLGVSAERESSQKEMPLAGVSSVRGNCEGFTREMGSDSGSGGGKQERDRMTGTVLDEKRNCIRFSTEVSDHRQLLEKYAFSNGLQLSVKLGIWENLLDEYIKSMGEIPRRLKDEEPLGLSRKQILKKTGELLYFRHNINLLSDLLDTPDFYWDRPELESYFNLMYKNLDLKDRTQVINNKLTYSHELAEVLRTHLEEKHSLKLEWCIIGLITVEVVFECIHYADRYLS